VPVQRPADAAALLDAACVDEPCPERGSGGRHRARDRDRDADRHHEARGGRHRAPDPHREHPGGRHRAPEQDDQRSTPYRFVVDDGTGQDEAGRGERGRSEVRAERADRHEWDRTTRDAAKDRSSDDDPPGRRSGAHDHDGASGHHHRASGDDSASGDDGASGDDVDWFSAA
jgi:hypothetical protein